MIELHPTAKVSHLADIEDSVRGTRIVEFISSDLEMTDARMATVGEKLLSADLK